MLSKIGKAMKKAISTERLDLAPSVEPYDLDRFISDLLASNDVYFLLGMPYSDELLEVIDFHSSGVVYYSIFLKDTQPMVGYIGIFPYEDEPAYGEIEFYIFHDYRRQGFCTEAMTAYIDSFFSGVLTGVKGKRVAAETLSENKPVMCLLGSFGFEKESWRMRVSFNDEGEIDTDKTIGVCRYQLSAETWLTQQIYPEK